MPDDETTPVPVPIQIPKLARANWKLPEQGLIKFGTTKPAKNRKGEAYDQPVAIPWFRFCSTDRDALKQLGAGEDGGPVLEWKTGFGQDAWQVTTRRSRIRVTLPANPVSDPQYERFAGGSRDRICDGETCTLPRGSLVRRGVTREEAEEVDCVCAAEGSLTCKPTTRLRVMLPDLDPMIGVWRLDCKGKHAAQELPGMAAMIVELQGQGLAHAWLDLAERSEYGWNPRTKKRELHHYVTPRLAPAASLAGLLTGDALAVGGRPQHLALGPGRPSVGPMSPEDVGHFLDPGHPDFEGPPSDHLYDPNERAGWDASEMQPEADDDIVDAEVVPDDTMAGWDAAEETAAEAEAIAKRLRQRIAMQFGDDLRHALAEKISEGRTRSTKELDAGELERLAALARRSADGEVQVTLTLGGEVKVIGRKRG